MNALVAQMDRVQASGAWSVGSNPAERIHTKQNIGKEAKGRGFFATVFHPEKWRISHIVWLGIPPSAMMLNKTSTVEHEERSSLCINANYEKKRFLLCAT